MSQDAELLGRYASEHSESAFAELIRRNVDLVYSAALRLTGGDIHRAEDITQQVFTELARQAQRLTKHPALAGWLYTTTRRMTLHANRAQQRWQAREQEANSMNELLHSPATGPEWNDLRSVLDEAMHNLGEKDRLPVLLRYFQNKSLKEVGVALGLSENAARMRVERALEKLRAQLVHKGVTSTATALVVILTSNAITAAPSAFVATLTSASLAGATAASGTTLTLLKLMTATKLKLGVVSAVIVAGVLVALLLQREGNETAGQNNPSVPLAAPEAMDSVINRRSASVRVDNLSRRETNAAPAATPEEIVTGKLTQFVRSRRELANALARRNGVKVFDEVKRFFDAAEGGRYEEMQTIFKSLCNRRNIEPDSHDFDSYWSVILQTAGVAEQAHIWPAQKLLDYGNGVLESLRPGMVYVGGSDPGLFIPMLLNETRDGERHIILTQNALADSPYLDYLNAIYGNRIATLTQDDLQNGFQEYIADYQKRLAHDEQFPNEPRQIYPNENVRNVDGILTPSGEISVMAVNQILLLELLQKNPDLAFAMQESFSLPSSYVNGAPLGPLIELRGQDGQNALTAESAGRSVDYWRDLSQQLFADPETPADSDPRKIYAHMAEAHANLFADHQLNDQAEQAYRIANTLWPDNSQILGNLSALLVREGRVDEANQLLDKFARSYPKQQTAVETIRGRIIPTTAPVKPSN